MLLPLILLAAEPTYFPPAGAWAHKPPAEVGMNEGKLNQAVEWAKTQDSGWDFSQQTKVFGALLGPIPKSRAATNGVVIKNGYIVAEWGDTAATDPTYSIAKSYLSTILGLTLDRKLIPSVTDPVANLIHDGGYDGINAPITWQHHVTHTSEWSGTMFGKDDTLQGAEAHGQSAIKPRERKSPGHFYEYNDVRINRFSLSMLRLWKKPLPEVLKTELMDKIGASTTWKYIPYDNAKVDIDGTTMPSISGGTRWGGGLWISTLDHARVGYLFLRNGTWNGQQVLSESWITEATKPHPEIPGSLKDYGYLWWLNTNNAWPAAPKSSFAALGAGDNTIWVDREHDLVIVWRWHKGSSRAEMIKRVLEALDPKPASEANPAK